MEKSLMLLRDGILPEGMDARGFSPLALAYIGDAVYELLIRTLVVSRGSIQVNKMHKKSTSLVKAEAQSRMYKEIDELLTEEERSVFKRGRNAKSASVAKNATVIDYRMATGLEALVGYLYLDNQNERLTFLIHQGLERLGEQL